MAGSENPDLPDVRDLPVLPLKDAVLFPHAMRPFQVDHPGAVRLIDNVTLTPSAYPAEDATT